MCTIYQFDHQPAEHFGRLGYERLTSLVDDYSRCPSDECDETGERQRRWLDMQVLFALRDGWPKAKRGPRKMSSDEPREHVVDFAGHRIGWHLSLPELRVWSGQASLDTTIDARIAAIRDNDLPHGTRLIDWQVPLRTASGIDGRSAPNALDLGFSPNVLGVSVMSWAALELLAIIGMEVSPITRFGDRLYGYRDDDGQWWQFSTERRGGQFQRKLTGSRRITDAIVI